MTLLKYFKKKKARLPYPAVCHATCTEALGINSYKSLHYSYVKYIIKALVKTFLVKLSYHSEVSIQL